MSKYKSPFSVDHRNPIIISSRDPRAKNNQFQEYLARSGREVIIKKDVFKKQNIRNYPSNPESLENIPSGGQVTLLGDSIAGSMIVAETNGWSNTPSETHVFITTSFIGTPTDQDTIVAESFGVSCSYTINVLDTVYPPNQFKAFATASNVAGTSIIAESINVITANDSSIIIAPTTAPQLSPNSNITIDAITYDSEGHAITLDNQNNEIYNTAVDWTTSNNFPTFYEWQVYSNSFGTMSGTNYGDNDNVLFATSSWPVDPNGIWASWRVRAGNSAGVGPWSNITII